MLTVSHCPMTDRYFRVGKDVSNLFFFEAVETALNFWVCIMKILIISRFLVFSVSFSTTISRCSKNLFSYYILWLISFMLISLELRILQNFKFMQFCSIFFLLFHRQPILDKSLPKLLLINSIIKGHLNLSSIITIKTLNQVSL